MRRSLIATALLIATLSVPAASASARPYVADCGNTSYLKLKPNRWSGGCTGGSLNLYGLRWSWYGESTAAAKGRAELRVPCGTDPTCPEAGVYKATARVRMTKPRTCTTGPAAGSKFFSKVRARVHFRGGNPFGYRAGWKTYNVTITAYEGRCDFSS